MTRDYFEGEAFQRNLAHRYLKAHKCKFISQRGWYYKAKGKDSSYGQIMLGTTAIIAAEILKGLQDGSIDISVLCGDSDII